MRTTVTVDDDVLDAVKERARREHRSVGAVLSDLARTALTGQGPTTSVAVESFFGFEPLPPRGGIVTNDLVNQIREDEGV